MMNPISFALVATAALTATAGCVRGSSDAIKGDEVASASPSAGPLLRGSDAATSVAANNVRSVQVPAFVEKSCNDICERSRQLACSHADECVPNCQAMGIISGCADQVAAMYRCLVQHRVSHWECADDGVAAIREGYCDKEQEQAIKCIESNHSP
jgi:hypothetical protein